MGLLSRIGRVATALTKYYSPFTWRDKPSIESPINAVHLNHMEDGINEMDNRILILAQDKADAADMANVIIDFTMNDTTGVMTFTRFDGSTFTHDTAIEKIALNCYLEGDNFVLELADGTKQKVSLSKFIDTYTFASTDTIRMTVNGKNISADIPDGKITLAKLEPTVLSTIRQYTLDAQTAKGVSEQAASTAQGWAIGGVGFEGNNAREYAEKAQRYAVITDAAPTDNAQYYCQQAEAAAEKAAGSSGYDGTATSVTATDTHNLGSANVQGQLDALAVGLENVDVELPGKDISETVISTLDTVSDSFPVPAAGEIGRTFFGKVKKFIADFNAMRATLLTLSKIVNNGLTTQEGFVADARQLNPDIEGTLANQLRNTNSNIAYLISNKGEVNGLSYDAANQVLGIWNGDTVVGRIYDLNTKIGTSIKKIAYEWDNNNPKFVVTDANGAVFYVTLTMRK